LNGKLVPYFMYIYDIAFNFKMILYVEVSSESSCLSF